MKLAIVTATLDHERAMGPILSWFEHIVVKRPSLYVVQQGGEHRDWERYRWEELHADVYVLRTRSILGVVPAFARGVEKALADGADIVACFHDDLEITEPGWADLITFAFQHFPAVGLAGFGGASGLADEDIYQKPYNPMQLARKHFMSNMRDAEAHGERVTTARRVAVLDGFSLIGRRQFWYGLQREAPGAGSRVPGNHLSGPANLFTVLHMMGVVHHAYDAAMGAFAKEQGWEVWLYPMACHHHGGLTAVADPRYHEWAAQFSLFDDDGETKGDAAYWKHSHHVVYEMFRGVLPIRV